MPTLVQLRRLSVEEEQAVVRLTRSRTAPVRLVERARMVWLAHQGTRVPAIAAELGVSVPVVRRWVTRFNASGVAGLADAPRSGRPATYSAEEVGEVIATSLTDPRTLGLPFASWEEAGQAVDAATHYWNAHRHPFLWGRRTRHRPARPAGIAALPNVA